MRLFTQLILLCSLSLGAIVSGKTSFSVKIDGKETTLTATDITVAADTTTFKIEEISEEFTLDSPWTFFGFKKEGIEYNLKTWSLSGSCGCLNQICP